MRPSCVRMLKAVNGGRTVDSVMPSSGAAGGRGPAADPRTEPSVRRTTKATRPRVRRALLAALADALRPRRAGAPLCSIVTLRFVRSFLVPPDPRSPAAVVSALRGPLRALRLPSDAPGPMAPLAAAHQDG